MSDISIELTAFPPYIGTLCKACNDFCATQVNIDRSYNNVAVTWSDKNYLVTGQELSGTARDIKTFYAQMTDQMDRAKTYYNKGCDVIDLTPERLPQAGEFLVSLKEPTNMTNNTIITDIDALIDFKRSLDDYISTITDNVDSLVRSHKNMEGSWNDAHYYQFGEAIDSFSLKMKDKLMKLHIISQFLEKKIRKYEDAMKV